LSYTSKFIKCFTCYIVYNDDDDDIDDDDIDDNDIDDNDSDDDCEEIKIILVMKN